MLEDAGTNREDVVLELVKKYPLYSLNKLKGQLPSISRHSIQRILEKHKLSTIEKRLAFAASNSVSPLPPEASDKEKASEIKIKKLRLPLGNYLHSGLFKGLPSKLHPQRVKDWHLKKSLVFLPVIIFMGWFGYGYVMAKAPEINLETPIVNSSNQGEKLFVSGKVIPADSEVRVNGSKALINGNGNFTALIKIPMGQSALDITARNRGKEAKLLRVITRVMTKEEKDLALSSEERKRKEAEDKAAKIDRTINDLLAAKNATISKKGLLKIINNRVREEMGINTLIGEVINTGAQDVRNIMITVNFYSKTGELIDVKYGFAGMGQTLKPGDRTDFEAQSIRKDFDYYSLNIDWDEEPTVAGVATSAAQPQITTPAPAATRGATLKL